MRSMSHRDPGGERPALDEFGRLKPPDTFSSNTNGKEYAQPRAEYRYRFWQTPQKKVERCPWTIRLTAVPQVLQDWPARPYTWA
jgi:hypothetical protein